MTEPLIDHYHAFMADTWDGDEDDIPLGMLRKPDESITMVALAVDPEQAYDIMLSMIITEQATEAVFTLDRFTKPGQGTKYDDVLAGQYFDRSLGARPFRSFVIEYRKEPRQFEPVDYNNEFWNGVLNAELISTMRNIVERLLGSVQ